MRITPLEAYDEQLKGIWINITPKWLICKIDTKALADVYEHKDYEQCLKMIEPFISLEDLERAREHILFNYDHFGIKYEKSKPGDQISLF